jgi:hypothetical protein
MTRRWFPGGSYVDATPMAFAVKFPDRFETSQGRIPFPADGNHPLYHRITDVDWFKFAGQAQVGTMTLEWADGMWHERPMAVGVSPVIYDLSGVLHLSDGSVGSQGYRYVAEDGRLVTGDETYSPNTDFAQSLGVQGLSQWSAYGGVYVGQGYDGGALVWDGAVLRLLEPGECTFIRVQGVGDAVAVSIVKPDGAVIIDTTVAELRALPPVEAPEPEPLPPEPTPEPPEPIPEPPDPEPVPPQPPPLFQPAQPVEVSMESVSCVLRMGSFYAQILPSQNGKGPFGWYPVAFTQDRADTTCHFTRSSPDGERLLLRHDATQAALGADATEFIAGGNVCAQLYGKPNLSEADWGGYEAWHGWELDQDRRIVLVEYDREDGRSTSLCLTVEDR